MQEATHVWQYQNNGTRYITCSLYHQAAAAIETGTRNAAYYNDQLNQRSNFGDYPAEQQAQIVEDFYSLTDLHSGPHASLPAWVIQRRPDMPHYEPLMRQVRSARPRSQAQIYSDALIQPPRQNLFPPPNRSVAPFPADHAVSAGGFLRARAVRVAATPLGCRDRNSHRHGVKLRDQGDWRWYSATGIPKAIP